VENPSLNTTADLVRISKGVIMRTFAPVVRSAYFWGTIIMLVIGCAAIFQFLIIRDDEPSLDRHPYQLTLQELAMLRSESAKGNCSAAYSVAQYHLYFSLNMQEAEKYYRLAAKCPSAKALAGLINVLREPEHDAEIDELLVSLTKLDPKMGRDALLDVELRRAERTSQ
jgi:hypothetical protein